MTTICPCCRKILGAVHVEQTHIEGNLPRGFKYFAALCRHCGAFLALIPFPV
jgi:hypothetical protein